MPHALVFVGPRGGYRGLDRHLVVSLLQQGHRIIEVNFDSTSADTPIQLPVLVDLVAQAVDQATQHHTNGNKKSQVLPAVVGYSLGAQVAALFAAEHPASISSLTLIAGWFAPTAKMCALNQLWQEWRNAQCEDSDEISAPALRASHLVLNSSANWQGQIDEKHVLQAMLETELLMDLCVAADVSSAFHRIVDPTLVIGCTYDEFASVQQSRLVFGAIQDSRYTEVNSGHLVCIERPAELVSLIDEFVADPHQHPPGTRIPGFSP